MLHDVSIMVVEPDTIAQTKICNILEREFNISNPLITRSSQEAMSQIAGKTNIDCVIINSRLQDGSGFSLVSDIKKIEKFSGISIFVISEKKDREHLLNAAACGASDFIVKPINDRSFIVKLKKLIGGKHFRKDQRITTFEAFNAEIHFKNHGIYQARLLDISNGGCSLKADVFNQGGCVYDSVKLHIGTGENTFVVDAELTRIERDPEYSDDESKKLLAAFEFVHLAHDVQQKLEEFISQFSLQKY